jgi:hypothetical protein
MEERFDGTVVKIEKILKEGKATQGDLRHAITERQTEIDELR